MRSSLIRAALATGILVAATLSGCSASAPSATESAPRETSQKSVVPHFEEVDELAVPEDIYLAGFSTERGSTDRTPQVGWLVRGKSLLLMVYEGGSCPLTPKRVDVISETEIAVEYDASIRNALVLCFAEPEEFTRAIALPEGVTGRPLTVTLDFTSDYGSTKSQSFELD